MNFFQNLKTWVKQRHKGIRRYISSTFLSFTPQDLQRAIQGLGVAPGDVLLVHSSFDAFEGFQGKASDVIAALQVLVGTHGSVMMPTMSFSGTAVDYAKSNQVFDVARTPSGMGLLSEIFRRSPGVVRSVHPTHPVAIWGVDAASLAAGHHLAATPCGVGTPFEALLKRQGKIVLLGTGIGVLTFYHLLEETMEKELSVKPFTDEVFSLQSKTKDGQILNTKCRLFEPSVSKRRNLTKIIPALRKANAWHAARLGGLEIVVISAVDVENAVRSLSQRGIFCYD